MSYFVAVVISFIKLYRFYVGCAPYILVSDPNILNQVLIRDFDRFTDRAVSMLVGV